MWVLTPPPTQMPVINIIYVYIYQVNNLALPNTFWPQPGPPGTKILAPPLITIVEK